MLKATFKIVSGNSSWGNIVGDIQDQKDLINLVDSASSSLQGEIDEINTTLSALGETVSDNYITLDNKIDDTKTELANDISDLASTVSGNYNTLDGKISDNTTAINNHIADKTNPHEVTKAQVGLGNVDNTSDLNKPISTATQTALNTISGNLTDETNARIAADNLINADIDDIQDLIPNQASTSNQLADKQFVNSAIQTNSAHFRGNWSTWADVPTDVNDYPADDDGNKTPTTNDYMVVRNASDYTGDTLVGTWQFTYTGLWATNGKSGWQPRFQINESPLTPAQQTALDSGITPSLVSQISTNQGNITSLQTNKQDVISDLSTIRSNAANGQSAYTTIQGYGNIVTYNASAFATASQGAKADTAVQPSAITNMQTTTNLVTSVSSSSTDSQYPSAKLFYDTVGNLETLLHTINSGNN